MAGYYPRYPRCASRAQKGRRPFRSGGLFDRPTRRFSGALGRGGYIPRMALLKAKSMFAFEVGVSLSFL